MTGQAVVALRVALGAYPRNSWKKARSLEISPYIQACLMTRRASLGHRLLGFNLSLASPLMVGGLYSDDV